MNKKENDSPKPPFIYRSAEGLVVNLLDDIVGRNSKDWTAHCFDAIFTNEEIGSSTVYSSDNTNRGFLDVDKVKLIKDAFDHKYADIYREKRDKIWHAVCKRICGRGRSFNYKIRHALHLI